MNEHIRETLERYAIPFAINGEKTTHVITLDRNKTPIKLFPVYRKSDSTLSDSQETVCNQLCIKTFLILENLCEVFGFREFHKAEIHTHISGHFENAKAFFVDIVLPGLDCSPDFIKAASTFPIIARRLQRLLVWTGSKKDIPIVREIRAAFDDILGGEEANILLETNVRSCHKEPVLAVKEFSEFMADGIQTVALICVGKSNGAGPTLSAQTIKPTLTMPVDYKTDPINVFSSLNMPSGVPVATVTSAGNAVLQALQMLAMQNPLLYAILKAQQEKRLVNFTID